MGEESCNSVNLAEKKEKLLISKFSGPWRLYPVAAKTIKTIKKLDLGIYISHYFESESLNRGERRLGWGLGYSLIHYVISKYLFITLDLRNTVLYVGNKWQNDGHGP